MNKIYDKYNEVFKLQYTKNINKIIDSNKQINEKIDKIETQIKLVKQLKEILVDYKEEKKKADKIQNERINKLKMDAESAIENFKKGEQIKVELKNYGYVDEEDFKQQNITEKENHFSKKIY